METKGASISTPKSFSSPEEEFAHLGKRMESREAALTESGHEAPRAQAAHEVVQEHRAQVPGHMVQEEQAEGGGVDLPLTPEAHDQKMGELISIMMEKGARRAIAAAEATGSAHLVDDFHRILSAYLSEGYGAKGLARGSILARSLSMVLYEIALPEPTIEEGKEHTGKHLKELLSSMEQLYQGMLALPQSSATPGYFSLEIANPVGSSATVIYAAVPNIAAELFEKQMAAAFPTARVTWRPDDYNIFSETGHTAGAYARLHHQPIFSLKTFESFEYDPLNAVLASFSKLDREREGASLQFIISPNDLGLLKRYQRALEHIRHGTPLAQATNIRESLFARAFFAMWYALAPSKKVNLNELHLDSDPHIKAIEQKVAHPLLRVNVRVIASGTTRERAATILNALEAPFQQFKDTAGNDLLFTQIADRSIVDFARKVSFRLFDAATALPLSTAEMTTLMHLPPRDTKSSPELRSAKANQAPAPMDLPQEGVSIGINRFRGGEQRVRIAPEDRLRHLYVIGQTGTGKSTLLKNIIIQDIKSGAGVCMIDPHGSDVLEVLSAVPPERMNDVIYFDPASMGRPMGLNMLEYDARYPEQKSLVVDELLGIFKKLFGAIPESMGPAFEQYFRNAALLVMDDPSTGSTLLDISRIFSDTAFRTMKLSRCKNPTVLAFWNGIALQAGGEQSIENYGPYVTSKFDVFTSNEIMRPIIAQQESAFNFRSLMDNKKILLVNLAKGRIGDINANLLGLIIVGKFLIAALSRADSAGVPGVVLSPYYLHIDEFQNFTTPSIASILSEARKYKLSLTVAHQFIAQLTDEIRDAVFGNVGSLCAFRVGADDAETLAKQFAPVFTAQDLMNVDNRNAYVRLLIHGRPEKPFSIETEAFMPGTVQTIDHLKEMSYLKYGRERAEVEKEIAARYAPMSSA
jgi:hypothetical protein